MHLYVLIDRVAMVFAKKVTAVSHAIAEDISLWKILKRKTVVIENGIDIEKYGNCGASFDSQKLRKELGLKHNTKLVGTLGRLTSQKAHHYLIEAAKIVLEKPQDVEFLVAGEGPRLQFLEKMAENCGVSNEFHFVGFRRDAINVLRLLDVFVLCSIDEGLPIVLLEAMSIGVPVVTSDVGEIPNILRDGHHGIIIKKGDITALAKNIEKLIGDEVLATKLGKCGKRLVRSKYSISIMTDKYIQIYSNFLKW